MRTQRVLWIDTFPPDEDYGADEGCCRFCGENQPLEDFLEGDECCRSCHQAIDICSFLTSGGHRPDRLPALLQELLDFQVHPIFTIQPDESNYFFYWEDEEMDLQLGSDWDDESDESDDEQNWIEYG